MDAPSDNQIILPNAFIDADIDHLVVLIADMLDRLMQHNDQIPLSPESLTRFHSRTPPGISILEYLRRIVKWTNVEKTCLLITLHYIDQVCARIPKFFLSSLTAHRFIITAVVVSSKALCDAFCTNKFYAKVGGIRVGELNLLEKEFLSLIDWRLTTTEQVLNEYYVNLIRTHSTGKYALENPEPVEAIDTIDASAAPVHADVHGQGAIPSSPSSSDGADSDMDSVRSTSPGTGAIGNGESTNVNDEDALLASSSASTTNVPMPIPVPVSIPTRAPIPSSASIPTQAPVPISASLSASTSTSAIVSTSAGPSSVTVEPSTVLKAKATLSPKQSTGPTLEQNMAFAALRSPQDGTGHGPALIASGSGSGSGKGVAGILRAHSMGSMSSNASMYSSTGSSYTQPRSPTPPHLHSNSFAIPSAPTSTHTPHRTLSSSSLSSSLSSSPPSNTRPQTHTHPLSPRKRRTPSSSPSVSGILGKGVDKGSGGSVSPGTLMGMGIGISIGMARSKRGSRGSLGSLGSGGSMEAVTEAAVEGVEGVGVGVGASSKGADEVVEDEELSSVADIDPRPSVRMRYGYDVGVGGEGRG